MNKITALKSCLLMISMLLFAAACGSKPGQQGAQVQSVPLGNATADEIVQTSVAMSYATQVVQDRISNIAPNYSNSSEQQMGVLVQPCTYTPDRTGGGYFGGATCPITYTQTFVGTSSPTSYAGTSTTNYSSTTPQYDNLDLVQSFVEVENVNSGFPNAASTTTTNIVILTASWSYISFTGTINMSAVNSSGLFTSTTTITGNSASASSVFGVAATGHVDSTTGNPVVDSTTCTLNAAVVSCASIGM